MINKLTVKIFICEEIDKKKKKKKKFIRNLAGGKIKCSPAMDGEVLPFPSKCLKKVYKLPFFCLAYHILAPGNHTLR